MSPFWRWIWNTSEHYGIGLGRFGPFVFGKMIGIKGKRVKEAKARRSYIDSEGLPGSNDTP